MSHLKNALRIFRVSPVGRDDGLVLASLSCYVAVLCDIVFIGTGASINYSTSWILYKASKAVTRERVSICNWNKAQWVRLS